MVAGQVLRANRRAEHAEQDAMPIKVTHVITDLDTGGAEMMLYKCFLVSTEENLIMKSYR